MIASPAPLARAVPSLTAAAQFYFNAFEAHAADLFPALAEVKGAFRSVGAMGALLQLPSQQWVAFFALTALCAAISTPQLPCPAITSASL